MGCGGYSPAAEAKTTLTCHYDGSSWTTSGSMVVARQAHWTSGSQTDAIAMAGYQPPGAATLNTEQYNGSNWVTGVNSATPRGTLAGSSTTGASAFIAGGQSNAGPNSNATEEFTGETTAARAVKTVDFD